MIAADVGEALVAALEEEGQLAMVEAQQLEDRGVQVVDVDADPRRRGSRTRRSRRSTRPPLTPPPASQMVKP